MSEQHERVCELCGAVDEDGYTRIGCGCSEVLVACSGCIGKAHYQAAKIDSIAVLRKVFAPQQGWNCIDKMCEEFDVGKDIAYAKFDQMEDFENLIEHGTSHRYSWLTPNGFRALENKA